MRKVYSPPPSGGGLHWMIIGSLAITLAVFLVLPLSQMISSSVGGPEELYVATVNDEPPPPPPVEEEPEPEEEEEPEEVPELESVDDVPRNLNFDLGDIGGSGGFLPSADSFADASGMLQEIDIFDMSELDSQPVLMSSISPRYPAKMRKAKIEGSVTIQFLLNEEGKVVDPRIEDSSRTEFEKPALDAVKRWKFKPGTKDGEPVKTYMRQPLQFRVPA